MRGLILAALLLALPAWAQAPHSPAQAPYSGAEWGRLATPTPGATRIIGGTGLGCIAGAAQLPAEGAGFEAVRRYRNRHWGSPHLVGFLTDLAGQARAAGFPPLLIGDMSQPRGGPMSSGHASHQNGLDADIWLDLRGLPAGSRAWAEGEGPPVLVLPDETEVDPSRFTPDHARLIRLAVSQPGVDRILVNHGIKRSLCRMHRGEPWLRRVRPWRGHDSHMHVRLRCPAGQTDCQDIAPPPPGDGCDASLDWWLSDEARNPPRRPPPPAPIMPASCGPVFSAR